MKEFNIVPFKHKYLPLIHELLNSQSYLDVDLIQTATLPKIGYLVLLNDQPIACGFLRRVEPCYAQFDTFATSKYFGKECRHKALCLVLDSLFDSAKVLKLKGIIATTADSGILERAQSIGFHIVNQTVIAKSLT